MPGSLAIHTHEFFPKWGGIGRYCQEFARGAAALGWDVTLYGPRTSRPVAATQTEPYRLNRCTYGPSHGPLNIWRSRAELATAFAQSPESIHLLAEPGPILAYGLLPAHNPGPTVLLTLHGSEIERWANSAVAKPIATRSFRRAAHIIVPSQTIADRLGNAFPFTATKTRSIAHALPQFFRDKAEGSTPRYKTAENRTLTLLSVGRIHPRKGFDQVLRALMHLPGEMQGDFRYIIAGARSHRRYENKLRELAQQPGSRVDFQLDPDDAELAEAYRAADCFILTSRPHRHSIEGFGLVYLEAAAFGLPCLAYRTGGVCEAIRDGETGILLPAQRADLLAAELRAFYENPRDYKRMGLCGRELALSRNWNKVARDSLAGTGIR